MEPELANEADGMAAAQALFEAEDTGPEEQQAPPKPVAEAEVAEVPEPAKQEAKTEPEKLEEEFVEFTGKQKERFNSVYGALKRLERENAELQKRVAVPQYQPQPVAQPVVPQPQQFTESKPKLADFQDADTWADAVSDWAARKAEHTAIARARQEFAEQHNVRLRESETSRQQQFMQSRIDEGRQKFGAVEFDNLSAEVANFVTPVMSDALFQLKAFPQVVVELGRNLHEADRISRLAPYDQIYELKALERRLTTTQELKAKEQQLKPTKVEAPGQGEAPKTTPSVTKLRNAAFESGRTADFAKLIEAADY